MSAPRYTVKAIRGMCIGAGAFVVVDTQEGSEWGMTLWREEAEKLARRWNAAHERETTYNPEFLGAAPPRAGEDY